MSPQTETAGALGIEQPAGKSHILLHCSTLLSRKEFFRDCIGRLLTIAIAAAGNNDAIVDRLLRTKDRLNRRGAR
jgi:hypothetical protein